MACDPSPTGSCESTVPFESVQGDIEGNLWLTGIIPRPTSTSSSYIGRPLEPQRATCIFTMGDRYTFDFHTVATHILFLFVQQNCVFFYFGVTELSRDLRAQVPAQLRAFTVFSSLSSRFSIFLNSAPLKFNELSIAHVRYIKILTWLWGFRVKNCKFFKTPLSRNSQKRLEHKVNQTK